MGDEMSGGTVVERSEKTEDDLYDLVEKIEDLKFQKQEEGTEISFFVSLCDRVQAVRDLREIELKGYIPSSYYQMLCSISFSSTSGNPDPRIGGSYVFVDCKVLG
jgi:hypothetical protein